MSSVTTPARTATEPFAALRDAKFLSLTTFRKDGTPVATPVWFAHAGNRLFVGTTAHSGKIKRVRNSGRVEIAPCTQRGEITGPTIAARARILPPTEADRGKKALRGRNNLQARAAEFFYRLRGWQGMFLELTPE